MLKKVLSLTIVLVLGVSISSCKIVKNDVSVSSKETSTASTNNISYSANVNTEDMYNKNKDNNNLDKNLVPFSGVVTSDSNMLPTASSIENKEEGNSSTTTTDNKASKEGVQAFNNNASTSNEARGETSSIPVASSEQKGTVETPLQAVVAEQPAVAEQPVQPVVAAQPVIAVQPAATPAAVVTESGQPELNLNNLGRGIVEVKYVHAATETIKVIIQKGSTKYTYNLFATTTSEKFPLQMGNGDYTISVLKNVGGTSYQSIKNWNVSLNLSNSNSVYLNSIQLINFTSSTNAVAKAREIAGGLANEETKVNAVYNYLITNMKYNSAKATSIPSNYIPNIEQVFGLRSGICYDFAASFAAMLRSLNIPTKLIMGNSTNVSGYHAWNEVYFNGSWKIIDTSYDSQVKAANQATTMIKSSGQYTKTKEY